MRQIRESINSGLQTGTQEPVFGHDEIDRFKIFLKQQIETIDIEYDVAKVQRATESAR